MVCLFIALVTRINHSGFVLGAIIVAECVLNKKKVYGDYMAKVIQVEIPRSTIQELNGDGAFAHNLYNAILEAEATGKVVEVPVGEARKREQVAIVEG